jgi:general secretion pathway protein L
MAEWLLLRLPRVADAPASWLACDSHGLSLSGPQSGTLAEAAQAAAGRRVCVLASAADILCTDVELPVRSGVRLQQVAPFALEEQLIGDVEQQHFALGRRNEHNARTPVAVVARALLEDWLAQLRAAGLSPELLCTETALLPRNPGYRVALLDGELFSVVGDEAGAVPVTVPADDPAAALQIAAGGADFSNLHLLLHMTPLDWQRRGSQFEALRPQLASLKVQLLNSGLLPWLAPQLAQAAPINLLQGEFAPRTSLRSAWPRWRLAAVLAGALLLLHVGVQLYTLVRLRNAERAADATLAQIGNRLGSAAAGSGSLRQRVQQRLATAQAGGADSGLLNALQSIATAMSAAPGSVLQALSYRDGGTELKLRAADAQVLERINQGLRGSGWQSELVSGTATADAYEGRITLRPGGGGS